MGELRGGAPGPPPREFFDEEHSTKSFVASLRDITATLGRADPADKAAVYAEMGITVTYNQDGRVLVESRPRVVDDGVGGAIPMGATRRAPLSRWYSLTA